MAPEKFRKRRAAMKSTAAPREALETAGGWVAEKIEQNEGSFSITDDRERSRGELGSMTKMELMKEGPVTLLGGGTRVVAFPEALRRSRRSIRVVAGQERKGLAQFVAGLIRIPLLYHRETMSEGVPHNLSMREKRCAVSN